MVWQIFTGLITAIVIYYLTGLTWHLTLIFWLCAAILLTAWSRGAKAFHTTNPVDRYRAGKYCLSDEERRKGCILLPRPVRLIGYFYRVMIWAGVGAALISVYLIAIG